MADRVRVTISGGVLVEIPASVIERAIGAERKIPRVEITELETLDEVLARYCVHVLAAVDGNKTRAAKILGIDRRSLYRWIAKARPSQPAAELAA